MKNKIKLLGLTILIYGVPILLWSIIPFTKNIWGSFSNDLVFNFLFKGTLKYSAIGIIFDIFIFHCIFILLSKQKKDITKQRVYLIYSGIKNLWKWIFKDYLQKNPTITKEEKTSLLFYLVKLYFTPVVVGFSIGNLIILINALHQGNYRIVMLYLIFAIDTIIFSLGYLFESSKLNNVVKSVDATILGWAVTIMWYPPIQELNGKILGWYTSDFSDFGSVRINAITGIISIFLLLVYFSATLALGFKASNLTNRGIISKGPYKYIRHPAYASKNISWWIMAIPFIKIHGFIAIFSMIIVSFIYFLRSITEERHLSKDPEYVTYMQKVKYRFIPGIF